VFTGIVADTGTVDAVTATDDGRRLRIGGSDLLGGAAAGDSVSVSGACLTVEDGGDDWIEVFTATETLAKTTLGGLVPGDRVNLERPLPADDRLDGHFVQGHVDATTELVDRRREGEDWTFEWALPEGHARYVAAKGSIALDGISLTVAERTAETFTTAIVPTTFDVTTLAETEPGDAVNVEVDVLAKYVERMVADRDEHDGAGEWHSGV
jgi:riboflavin synthase